MRLLCAAAEPALPSEVQEQLCTPEHEFVQFTAWYNQKDIGGQLVVPGIADLDGYMADSTVILRSRQEDENIGLLIEATLWSKGIPRIDARMVITKAQLKPGQETFECRAFACRYSAPVSFVGSTGICTGHGMSAYGPSISENIRFYLPALSAGYIAGLRYDHRD